MKATKIIVSIVAFVSSAWMVFPASAVEKAGEASAQTDSAETFNSVVSKLDLGGDALVYFNIEGLISEFVKSLITIIPAAPQNAGQPDIASIGKRAEVFLENIGAYDMQAYGFSSMPVDDGQGYFLQKSFLKIEEVRPTPMLWRIVGKPSPIDGFKFMPKDTVVMGGGHVDLGLVMELFQKAALEVGGRQTRQALDRQFAELEKSMGIDLLSLCNSLRDELVFGIQLSETDTFNITGDPTNPIEMGVPSFLLVAKTDKAGLVDQLLKLEQKKIVEFEKMETDSSAKMFMLPAIEGAPFPIRICFLQAEEYFLAGSNRELLLQALRVFDDGTGLVNSDEFRSSMEGMPAAYSSLTYVSKRYMETILQMQRQMAEMTPGPNPQDAMNTFYGDLADGDTVGVELALPNGFYSVTKAPYGGKQILKSFMMMPVGMIGAVAVPSFVNARESSQRNMMINNLRMINAAKEQWAMANDKAAGAQPTEEDIGIYLRNGMPTLPLGGRYEINPIGQDPLIILPDGEKIELP